MAEPGDALLNPRNSSVKHLKRVLFLLEQYELGGAERQAFYLARSLNRTGDYDVVVGAFSPLQGAAYDLFHGDGIPCYTFDYPLWEMLRVVRRPKRVLRAAQAYASLAGVVRRLAPDIILPFTYPPNVVAGLIWRFTGASMCVWNQRDEGRLFEGRRMERLSLGLCSHVVSNSMVGMTFLRNHTVRPVTLIHNGIHPGEKVVPRRRTGADEFAAVMVANLHGHKDHATLIRAWRSVVDSEPGHRPQLNLAGRFDGTHHELKALAFDLGLSGHVNFMGAVKDVPSLLSTCHVGVLSSVYEGLPNAILEYMVAGLPVVATRIPGAEEILGEDYPFLCEPGDAETMAQFILQFLRDETLFFTISVRNLERVKTHFGIERMVASYRKLLGT